MNVIYIGDKFYWDSKTMMSSVYQKLDDEYIRTDWGFIQIALSKGETVNIRPATENELLYFKIELQDLKKTFRKEIVS